VNPDKVSATNRNQVKVNEEAFKIREEFKPEPGDVVIYKERASGFFGTPLIAHLTQKGIDSLIVCGESTSGCVRASCVDAYSLGYHVSIVEECVFDRSILSHKVNLFDLHHKYADVMTLDEVKESLQQERPRNTV
jgi:maleamate amidohydrolase